LEESSDCIGIGHIYAGKVGRGIGILIGGLVMLGLSLWLMVASGGLSVLPYFFGLGYLVLFIWQIFKARSLGQDF
jgi:hypothetical protein